MPYVPRLRAIALLLALFPAGGYPQELIANPSVKADTITRTEARLFFTMRLRQWPDRSPVHVFVLGDEEPLHKRFAQKRLGLFPYQLRRVWDRQVFSGTGQAPTTVANEAEMIERVSSIPGALGYATATPENPTVKSLEVR